VPSHGKETRQQAINSKGKDLTLPVSCIHADAEDVKAKRFGPRVREWIKKMISKAVDASWQIELGVAGNLLTDALKAYYGW
jgi:hypothetical protein